MEEAFLLSIGWRLVIICENGEKYNLSEFEWPQEELKEHEESKG